MGAHAYWTRIGPHRGEWMSASLEFLAQHGYALLFGWVLAEQAGLPLPAVPLLIAAGALAGTHRISPLLAVAIPLLAVGISDTLWYQLGRQLGMPVLRWFCQISLEPDSCVRGVQLRFGRNGGWSVVVARFIPGFSTVTTVLAGISRMPFGRFAFLDGLGALLWASTYVGTGYVFHGAIQRSGVPLALLSKGVFPLLLAGLGAYVGWKYLNRRRSLRQVHVARITPEELRQKVSAGEDVFIVDLRRALEFEAEPETIPGAVQIESFELEKVIEIIPRDREIVLFCDCPNEAAAAQMALRLRAFGIARIRTLSGGFAEWRRRGFPVHALTRIEENGSHVAA
jgi:membrane protein DedA with SNARE-associated domain/rhodanese-related sulfurtransferase